MIRKPNLHKRMYAVSLDRVGIIAGTMAYSRRAAIGFFLDLLPSSNWEKFKHAGYRTVLARVEVIRRNGLVRTPPSGFVLVPRKLTAENGATSEIMYY